MNASCTSFSGLLVSPFVELAIAEIHLGCILGICFTNRHGNNHSQCGLLGCQALCWVFPVG